MSRNSDSLKSLLDCYSTHLESYFSFDLIVYYAASILNSLNYFDSYFNLSRVIIPVSLRLNKMSRNSDSFKSLLDCYSTHLESYFSFALIAYCDASILNSLNYFDSYFNLSRVIIPVSLRLNKMSRNSDSFKSLLDC
jgi:hypothetical protein